MENMSEGTNLKKDSMGSLQNIEQECFNNDLNNCDSSDDLDNEIEVYKNK
jgi:hypothetical protein